MSILTATPRRIAHLGAVATLTLIPLAVIAAGCFVVRPSAGGGETAFAPPRTFDAADVALPPGYRIDLVAHGLTFPTGITFDDGGRPYVTESGYSYGEVWGVPRLLRVEPNAGVETVATGEARGGPWNGVAFHDGAFYVAEGGQLDGGRILRIDADGSITALIANLPTTGDHHVNGPTVGADRNVYFGVGTFTNAAVIGRDNFDFGWLGRHPDRHDIPCSDVTLVGRNFESENFLLGTGLAVTGAFLPFASPSSAGQVIAGKVPCNGAVLRVSVHGGPAELVAWGFRNPFGLAFSPDGRLWVTDNSYDDRGSRRVHGAGDLLWDVKAGAWYGWPDFHGSRRLDDGDHFDPPRSERPTLLLARHPGESPRPSAVFAVHSSSDGLDFSRSPAFGHVGQAFVAQFGDQAPAVGKVLAPVGFKVVRVDVETGVVVDFAVNRGRTNGPASHLGSKGLERPIAVRFDPSGELLYVVDFGVLTMNEGKAKPMEGTGALWRISRAGVSS